MASVGIASAGNMSEASDRPTFEMRELEGALLLELSGNWATAENAPELSAIEQIVSGAPSASKLSFDCAGLVEWNTQLLVAIRYAVEWAEAREMAVDRDGLPEGIRNLLNLADAVPRNEEPAEQAPVDFFTRMGERTLNAQRGLNGYFEFLGQLVIDLFAFLRGRGRLRRQDFWILLQETGPAAVPIVSLLCFLTGLIIAFIGVIQLQKFAADIYVADLVGLATTRELGAVMAGVIMAGRTGAAFAAQIGSMRVNQEIDALTTFGISPMQFLVVPRVLALVIMMPLLCVCANFVGIMGGMVVAVSISDVGFLQYFYQVQAAVGLADLFTGIFKSAVFGVIIALAGCYRGLNCGNNASSVGLAATSAVVTSITWIVIADAIFAVMFHLIGI